MTEHFTISNIYRHITVLLSIIPLLPLYPLLPLHLPLLLPLLLLLLHLLLQLVGWAAADSDWSGRTWGSPYAIAVMDIEGFVQENQAGPGGSGGSKFIGLDHSYVFS